MPHRLDRLATALTIGAFLALATAPALSADPMMQPAAPATPTLVAPPAPPVEPATPVKLSDAEWALRTTTVEKQLRRIRFQFFTKAKPETRKAGIERLREFTDVPAFPVMLEVFRTDQDDVRRAVIDHFGRINTDESLTTLAYAAINEADPSLRNMAREKLVAIVRKGRARPAGVDTVINNALHGADPAKAGLAARLVQSLGILEAIPALIMSQVGGGSGGQTDAGTAIAWILIGNQRAYVADLTPVVGDSSVGFDPTPGVVTDGVVLKIGDAVITTYRVEVHQALVEMTSNIAGKDTSGMGYNQARWTQWYHDDFANALARRAAEAKEAAKAEADAKAAAEAKAAADKAAKAQAAADKAKPPSKPSPTPKSTPNNPAKNP